MRFNARHGRKFCEHRELRIILTVNPGIRELWSRRPLMQILLCLMNMKSQIFRKLQIRKESFEVKESNGYMKILYGML